MSPLAFSTTINRDRAKPAPGHREYIAKTQYFRCHFCNRVMDMTQVDRCDLQHGYSFTVEHVIPRSRGGTNDLSNKVASCYRCNTIRNYIESRLQGRGQWEDIDIPVELFLKLLPVDFHRWNVYNRKQLEAVIERMRWGRETFQARAVVATHRCDSPAA